MKKILLNYNTGNTKQPTQKYCNLFCKLQPAVMSEPTEPELKKAKMAETVDGFISGIMYSKHNLQPVMSDDICAPMTFTKVYIGHVKDVKELSKIVLTLNGKMPIKELSHLKRAQKKDVLLCPVCDVNCSAQQSIQEFLEENLNELKDSFEYFKVQGVPSFPPKLKKQHIECNRVWSCNFHPNKYLEKLTSNKFFSGEEVRINRLFMGIAFEVARYYLNQKKSNLELSDLLLSDINATVVVDPMNNSIVAVCFDNREKHPIQHSAMLAIDNVAKTQKGGAWDTAVDIEISLCGVDKELYLHLKRKYTHLKFGARNYITKEVLDEKSMNALESPYLCTGYHIYMIREPCVMCSMALVHARAKRVFFCFKNCAQGALISKTKLHHVPSLNHHFEVFTDFL